MFYCCLLHTCGISIALPIQSLDPRWGLGARFFVFLYTFKISIALAYRSLDPKRNGGQCPPYITTLKGEFYSRQDVATWRSLLQTEPRKS